MSCVFGLFRLMWSLFIDVDLVGWVGWIGFGGWLCVSIFCRF